MSNPMSEQQPEHSARVFLPSIFFIVFANLVPLAGVLWYDWSVFALLVLFWIENVITGLFNIPRIIMAKGPSAPAELEINGTARQVGQLGLAVFFCIHYGIFTFGHGSFVFATMATGHYGVEDTFTVIAEYGLSWAILALLISHGFSFFYNYLYRGEYKKADFAKQMQRPYHRVIILHVTILLGGFLVSLMNEPLMGLIVLLGLKIVIDIKAHVLEHQGRDMPIVPMSRQRVSRLVSNIRGNK
jgi:hypothetical protein